MDNYNSYEELDSLVLHYQVSPGIYSEELVEACKGFLMKYVNLLNEGLITPSDDRMRQFVGFYIARPDIRRHLHQYMYMPNIKSAILNAGHTLAKIFSGYTKDEIFHEVVIVFLNMANHYVRGEHATFHLYMSKAFNYYLKKHVDCIMKDPLSRMEWYSYNEEYELETYNPVECDTTFERITESMQLKNSDSLVVKGNGLNLNWINGVTATGVFKALSSLEREILVMYYINNMNDEDIANELGYAARETICRKRNRAKAVIEQYVKDNNLYRLREGNNLRQESTRQMPRVQRKVPVQEEQDSCNQIKTRVYHSGMVG